MSFKILNLKRFFDLAKNPKKFTKKLIIRIPSRRFQHLLLKFPCHELIKKQIKDALIGYEKRPIFIFPPPNCPWGYLFQRPQQIARALAKKGFPVIYCVDIYNLFEPDWSVRGLKKIDSNLYLFNDGINGQLLRELEIPIILWQYWPIQNNFAENIKSKTIYVYDCIDDLNTFQSYDNMYLDHKKSLNRADLILASSDLIYKDICSNYDNSLLIPNGVCYEDFREPFQIFWPELDQFRKETDVIVGYYGAIADWFDFELLYYCAERFSNWTFLLVGQVYPSVMSIEKRLFNIKNIKIWSRQDYSKLPYLLSKFDVAIIPFKINDITRSTSPVKIFEYMAGGKPIVSTDLPECRKYSSILIGKSHEEFGQKLEEATGLKCNHDYMNLLLYHAKNNTWDDRVITVLDELKSKGLIPKDI